MTMNSERLNIAYIGGGSDNFGWKLIPELSGEDICAMVRLYDTDKSRALANEVIGNGIHDHGGVKGDVVYLACDEAEEALRDADFVILSFDPGSLEELVTELHLPETYGIFQPSVENSGPGSVIRALKIMPVCAEYARKISELCPNAWVISLCTPMAECISVMKKVFPKMKLVGADCSTHSCRDMLATIVCESKGITGVRRRDIKTNLLGIDGYSWFDEITFCGEDLFPMFTEYAEKYVSNGYEFRVNEYKNNPDADAHKVKFDLFLRYGLIPAQNDRITAGFCPPWYTGNVKEMNSWKFSPITAAYKKKIVSDKASRVKRYMNGEPLPKSAGTTEVAAMVRALAGGGNFICPVIMPNHGQVENLPEGTAVQTNALISRGAVRPVAAGALPEDILCLTLRHCGNQAQVVRAYETKDLDVAFNGFLNDPEMTCGLNDATELYRDMLSEVRKHLIYYCED